MGKGALVGTGPPPPMSQPKRGALPPASSGAQAACRNCHRTHFQDATDSCLLDCFTLRSAFHALIILPAALYTRK